MKMTGWILFPVAVLLAAGCKTTEPRPVTWKKQQAYMAKVRDPRIYGFSIYQTPGGVEFRGGLRLHPNQIEVLPMRVKEPLRPVAMLRGSFGIESPILFDFTAPASWLEFDLAQSLGAMPVGESKAQMRQLPGTEISGCLSMIPSIRFEQLYVEHPLVYVCMANGPLGSLARDVKTPEIKGVFGWDVFEKFEQIYLDYSGARMVFSTVKTEYTPDPSFLIARIPLVQHAGSCMVQGIVDGKPCQILIDPAGDFEVATVGAQTVASIQLATGPEFSIPAVSESPGGTRIGARLLRNFKITICPQEGMIYFEKPDIGKE